MVDVKQHYWFWLRSLNARIFDFADVPENVLKRIGGNISIPEDLMNDLDHWFAVIQSNETPIRRELTDLITKILAISEKYEEARTLLLELHAEFPNNPQINYQCAWIHDLLGLEREAIPFYEKAVREGLSCDELKGALLGMGSTYRCMGEYQKAKETFQHALELFPERHEYKAFLAMTHYNLGGYSKAMELLLNSLAETSQDEGVIRYQRAIHFYADKLDETW